MQTIWVDIAHINTIVIWKMHPEVLMNFNGTVTMTLDKIVYHGIFWKTCILSYIVGQFY